MVAVLLAVVGPVVFFNAQKFDFLVYTESNLCFHGVVALSVVSIYSYVNVVQLQFLFSACFINPLNPELNPICYLLVLLGAHHFLHVSRIRVKLLTFR